MKFNKEHAVIIEAVKEKDVEKLKRSTAINISSGLEIIKETYASIGSFSET